MKKGKIFKSIIVLAIITIFLSSFAGSCGDREFEAEKSDPLFWQKVVLVLIMWLTIPLFKEPSSEIGEVKGSLPDGMSVKNESGEVVGGIDTKALLKDPPIPDPGEDGSISDTSVSASLLVGQDQNIDFSQIVSSASEPPQDQIPVVDMPQDTPDIPQQDEGVTVADAEPPLDSPIKQPDDSSPIGGKPDDEPQDTPDTTEEEPSFGEQEQPHHEHDIYTYYQEDIVEGDNIQSITITVNIASGEVYGNHYFEGYIGDGYRTANYEFYTFLDSSDNFSTTSTATIYEDGQDIGEGTLRITGELADDMSFIAGDIIDETVGYGVMYYAYLTSQSKEDPSYEDY